MIQTRAILAAAYKARTTPKYAMHTHAFNTRTGKVICGKAKPQSLADEEATDMHAPPTCPACLARDRRVPQHQNDGPFLLKSLLQF